MKEGNSDRICEALETKAIPSFPREKATFDTETLWQSENNEAADIENSHISGKKSTEFIHLPTGFHNKLHKESLFCFLRKISPVFLEKLGLQSVV